MGDFATLLTQDQADAVKILVGKVNHILAMGTGLGKTYAILAAFEGVRRLSGQDHFLLVVGSKSSLSIWEKELKNRTPYNYLVCPTERIPQVRALENSPDVVVTEYTALPKMAKFLTEFFKSGKIILAVDEMHKIKNPAASLYKMIYILKCNAVCTWGATATPMLNHIEDLHSLISFLFPGVLGDITSFMRTYTIGKRRNIRGRIIREIVGYINLNLLHTRIQPYMFIRYPTMDVRFFEEIIEPRPEEESLYLQAAAGILGGDFRDFVGRLPDLQMVTDNAVVKGREPNRNFDILSSKEERLLSVVDKMRETGRAVIIYSSLRLPLYRVRELMKLKYRKARFFTITGSTAQTNRAKIESQFEAGDFLFITGAGGESLNLQASNVVIMYNLSFKVGEFIQVVGRIVRIDSEHDHMDVYVLESKDTIDTYKRMYLLANADRIRSVISPNPNLPEVTFVPSKSYIIQLRRKLLWRTRSLRRAQLAEGQSLFGEGAKSALVGASSGERLSLDLESLGL